MTRASTRKKYEREIYDVACFEFLRTFYKKYLRLKHNSY